MIGGILVKTANMCNCLKLESFDVELLFSNSRTELISFLNDNNIPTNMPTGRKIIVKSKLLSLDVVFYISCQFDGEKLIAITMSPDTYLEGKSLLCRYNKIQRALENELGYPRNLLWSIIYLLDPESSLYYWMRNGIKFEHYLLNRFGIEEIINIKLVSAISSYSRLD